MWTGSQPRQIATRVNLDPSTDTVVVRRHVRYIDGKPAIISDDYFDERIVEGTSWPSGGTTRENILAEAGYEQVYDITRSSPDAQPARSNDSALHRTPVAEHIGRLPPRTGQYGSWCRSFRDALILQYTILHSNYGRAIDHCMR